MVFPEARKVVKSYGKQAAFASFGELAKALPDRVLLARVDDIFRAWTIAEGKLPPEKRIVFDNIPAQRTFLGIKLANDGFIYPPSDTLEADTTFDSTQPYHGSLGWVLLSENTLKAHFGSIISFAKKFFKIEEEGKIDGAVVYNEVEERMDFRFKLRNPAHDSIRLVITFEPGYPNMYHDDDNWYNTKI